MDFSPAFLIIIGLFWSLMECEALRIFSKGGGRGNSSSAKEARMSAFSQGNVESSSLSSSSSAAVVSSKTQRNFWELVSSSSDIIPVQNRSSSSYYSPTSSSSSSASVQMPGHISLETRLQKLEHHFNTLKIYDEDCRQRLLCNLAENPQKFAPLSTALLDETSYAGDEKTLAAALLATNDGARLLTYIEAVQKGKSRLGCDVWTYRCPLSVNSMIDFKSLLIWKELSKWLTVQFVANNNKRS